MDWGRRNQRLTNSVTFDLSPCIQVRLTLLSAGHSCPTAAPQAGPHPQRTLPSQVAFPCSRTFHHSHCLRGKRQMSSLLSRPLMNSLFFQPPLLPFPSEKPTLQLPAGRRHSSQPLPGLFMQSGTRPLSFISSLSNPITLGGSAQMLHPPWAMSLSHSTGLTPAQQTPCNSHSGLRNRRLKREEATALPLKSLKQPVRYQANLY